MTEVVALRPMTYSYLAVHGNSDKKAKWTNDYEFYGYKNCLLNNETISKSEQKFKSEFRNVYNKEIIEITLGSDDDKRLQDFDNITSYPYGANVLTVCKTDLLEYLNIKWLKFMIM